MMVIELKIGSRRYKGWENVTVTKAMQSIAHTFAMDIFNGDQLSIEDDDIIQIIKDGEVFLTGYADDIVLGISDTKKPLKITGRSKAGDLIDCNIESNKQYSKRNVKQITSDLVKPFGIEVSSTLKLEPIGTFTAKIGETYFNAINRLCKQTNTLPISDEYGNIEIVKNEQKESSIILKDQDFKELSYPKKLSSRYSRYTYKKEGIVTDITDGVEKDDTVKRFRPFVAVNTEDKTNAAMAKWKKNFNKVEEVSLSATVYKWDLEINTIVKIETDIVNGSFLVRDIVYTRGDGGTVSKVIFTSKDAYV